MSVQFRQPAYRKGVEVGLNKLRAKGIEHRARGFESRVPCLGLAKAEAKSSESCFLLKQIEFFIN